MYVIHLNISSESGFEHLQSPNAFEECGPSTGWKWSYEIKGVPLPDCIRKLLLFTPQYFNILNNYH